MKTYKEITEAVNEASRKSLANKASGVVKKIEDRYDELAKWPKEKLIKNFPSRLDMGHIKSEDKWTIINSYISAEFTKKARDEHQKYFQNSN